MTHNPNSPSPSSEPRRALPSVAALLAEPAIQACIEAHSRAQALDAINAALGALRKQLKDGAPAPTRQAVVAAVLEELELAELQRIRPVVNATGILLHTGLGRAVLPQRAADALAGANRCVNLQIDLETGLRGKRHFTCEQLLCKLTGAEAALVVNNNAAATLLVLAALCAGREVVVSRGQLIEIGGSFRLPDCIHQSGATLVEVGTTNKTHLRDYEAVLTERTAALLRVNPSNYRIVGFSKEVATEELVSLKARREDLLVIDDLGCGALIDLARFGLPHEPTVQEAVSAGADIVLFSGDKLIGGPQSGIIVGKREHVQKIRKHPLTRMLRVGKLTDLALEHTLRLFLKPETLFQENPTLRMITTSAEEIRSRAEKLRDRIEAKLAKSGESKLNISVTPGESLTGGGSLPATPIPSWTLEVCMAGRSAEWLSRLLRRADPPVVARIERDAVVLDLRTVLGEEEHWIVEALEKISGGQ